MHEAWIGTRNGVHRLRDGALEPAGLAERHVSAVHVGRDGGGAVVLAGPYGDGLFRSADAGATWEELDGVTRIPGHEQWLLPYSPRAGAVRNVYGPPGRPARV